MERSKYIDPEEFYNLLLSSNDFLIELGKVSMLSGELEVNLKMFIMKNTDEKVNNKATLGSLISIATKAGLLARNAQIAFDMIKQQRNYLTHNLYSLLNGEIDETLLARDNLFASDTEYYTEKAFELNYNLKSLSDLIKSKLSGDSKPSNLIT